MTIAIVCLCFAALLVFLIIRQHRNEKAERIRAFKNKFGTLSSRRYPQGQLMHTGSCARDYQKNHAQTFYVDDLTWADLEMNRIFGALDTNLSPAGREYLYSSLRLPLEAASHAKELDELSTRLMENESEREKTWECFRGLRSGGRFRMDKRDALSLYEYLDTLTSLNSTSCVPSVIACAAFIASIVYFCFSPTVGILVLMAVIAVNLGSYFHIRGKLGNFFRSLQKAVALAGFAAGYSGAFPEKNDKLSRRIKELSDELSPMRRNAWLLELGSGSSSLPDVLMSYVRMLTHCDLIYFSRSASKARKYRDDLMELYRAAGFIETALATASFRRALPVWCRPEISAERRLHLENVYHPLIQNTVPNSIDLSQNLLLTGSNASGKSTFLRTAAIAVILGEALDTVPAKSAAFGPFAVMSSMSVSDSLESGASLYMAEIRSLKRITDAAGAGGHPILVCADEILRGTNTAERVAGSTEILRWLGKQNCLVLAATHDGELTGELAGDKPDNFVNMHFSESTDAGGVVFTYKIQPGAADSSNAIALLKRLGFPEEITERAGKEAAEVLAHTTDGV
jgi:energy-coupling factor transporter ATP-binding protein EcfA2